MISGYLGSLCSPLKFKRGRGISLLSIWKDTHFSPKAQLERFVKLNKVSIGKYSRVDEKTRVNNTTIGNFSIVSPNCYINFGRHPLNYLTPHSMFYGGGGWKWRPEWGKPLPKEYDQMPQVVIGNDVWIGMFVKVMSGVKIGDGAIIGTNSLVTKDVPPYAIVAGSPAKVIRYRFTPEIIVRLLEIKWWDLPDEEITKHIDLFHKPDITMDDLNQHFPK